MNADRDEVIAGGITRGQIEEYAAQHRGWREANPEAAAAQDAQNRERWARCAYWHGPEVTFCTKCGWSPEAPEASGTSDGGASLARRQAPSVLGAERGEAPVAPSSSPSVSR